MFRKLRRVKNEISAEEAKLLLKNNKRAAFSVHGDDGYPYTIPINFYYDEEENRIYFHSAKKAIRSILSKLTTRSVLRPGTKATWWKETGPFMYPAASCSAARS